MPDTAVASTQEKKPIEFLSLVSQGLQSPIAAVYSGTGRLQHLANDLSPEQRQLISDIHDHAKRLSTAFSSMLLLARNDNQTYALAPVAIPVQELLSLLTDRQGHGANVMRHIACPKIVFVEGDRALLETAFCNIFAVLLEALSPPRSVAIEVQPEEGRVAIHIICPLRLSIQTVRCAHDSSVCQAIGETPGLLLSLTSSLLSFTGGTLDMRETDEGRYRMTVRLPRVEG